MQSLSLFEAYFWEWFDLLWVPVTFLSVPKGYRIKAILFVLACVFMLRLQVELFEAIGFPHGLLGLMHAEPFMRGVICYGVFIGLFLLLAHNSPGVNKFVFMGAALTLFILSFCLSTAIMLL